MSVMKAILMLLKMAQEFDQPHAPWSFGSEREEAIKVVLKALSEGRISILPGIE